MVFVWTGCSGCMFSSYTRYSDSLHEFSFTILTRYSYVYANCLLSRLGRPWNYLSGQCFPLTYELNFLKYKVNRCSSSLGALQSALPYVFFSFAFNSIPY